MIRFLKSNNFAVTIAMLSVIVQSFHTFSAFYKISSLNGSLWGIAQAALFALIIDLAILFYTVRKNVRVTWMAGFVMVLINCYYYYSHLGLTFDFILGALLSLVIPVSVYYYSEEITDEDEVDASVYRLRLETVHSKWRESESENLKLKSELDKALNSRTPEVNIDRAKEKLNFEHEQDQSAIKEAEYQASLLRPIGDGIPRTDRPNR